MTINNIRDLAETLNTTPDKVVECLCDYSDYKTSAEIIDNGIIITTTANEYEISFSKTLTYPFTEDDLYDARSGLQCWADAIWCEERNKEKREENYQAFVASLTHGEETTQLTIEDAQCTMNQWIEEGSVEVPEGFTASDFARIWNELCKSEA